MNTDTQKNTALGKSQQEKFHQWDWYRNHIQSRTDAKSHLLDHGETGPNYVQCGKYKPIKAIQFMQAIMAMWWDNNFNHPTGDLQTMINHGQL